MRALISLSLFVATVSVALADLKADLNKIYAEQNSFMLKKDMKGLEKMWAKHGHTDFLYITKTSKQTGKEMLAMMKQTLGPTSKMMKSSSTVQSVTAKGNRATAKVISVYQIGMATGGDKMSVIAGKVESTDTWENVGGVWQIKQVKVTKDTATMDGKPIGG